MKKDSKVCEKALRRLLPVSPLRARYKMIAAKGVFVVGAKRTPFVVGGVCSKDFYLVKVTNETQFGETIMSDCDLS